MYIRSPQTRRNDSEARIRSAYACDMTVSGLSPINVPSSQGTVLVIRSRMASESATAADLACDAAVRSPGLMLVISGGCAGAFSLERLGLLIAR